MKVIFHEDFYQVYSSDPASAPGRMEAIIEVITPAVDFLEAEPASDIDILSVHTKSHITHVRQAGVYEVAALAAGGAIQTANLSLKEPSFGLIRPPGHHASSGSAWGIFSNPETMLPYIMLLPTVVTNTSLKSETKWIIATLML